MKLTTQDYKKGIVKLKVTDRDDLWYLSHIISPSDSITGITTRKIKIGSSDNAKITRKTYKITIKAEKLDLQLDSDTLRINGTNETEHDDIPKGSYQNISITIDDEITIKKEHFKKYEQEKLKEAASEKSPLLIALFDREEAIIAKTTKFGHKILTNLKGSSQKKNEDHQSTGNFYQDLYKTLEEYQKRHKANKIILATPAFYKEDFLKQISNKDFKKLTIQATCSAVNESAITEVLKDTKLKQILNESRSQIETNLMQELLTAIAKETPHAYSIKEVQHAANLGAVIKLLTTTKFITKAKEEGNYEEIDNLLSSIDKQKGEIHILNSEEEAGRRLDGLSGIAAILRYKIGN